MLKECLRQRQLELKPICTFESMSNVHTYANTKEHLPADHQHESQINSIYIEE